jgi:hypothetical protein
MERKILIVGDIDICRALRRAILDIEPIKRTLIRFLYSHNFNSKILICNNEHTIENLKTQSIRLIIIDNPNSVIIQKIRFGEFGDTVAKIPIIVFSVFSYDKLGAPLILYHITVQKTFLEIPFLLEKFREILESTRFLDEYQLENIRSDKKIFSELIDSERHSLTEKDYKEKTLNIIKLAEINFPGIYTDFFNRIHNTLKQVDDDFKKLSDLKNALSQFSKELINEQHKKTCSFLGG